MKRTVKKSPEWYYGLARNSLLGFLILTVANILLDLIDSDSYYLGSIRTSYTFFSLREESAVYPVIGVLILVAFLLGYILSKKSKAWLIVGTVLLTLDLLFDLYVLVLIVSEGGVGASFYLLLEIILHIVGIVLLALGLKHAQAALQKDVSPDGVPAQAYGVPVQQTFGDPAQQGYPAPAQQGYPAPTQQGYAAPVQQGYAAPAQQGYAAPTQQGYAAPAQQPAGFTQYAAPVSLTCSVSVSQTGNSGAYSSGQIDFQGPEIIVSSVGVGAQILIGSLLSSLKERARFTAAQIANVEFTGKGSSRYTVALTDGTKIYLAFTKKPGEQFCEQMRQRGVKMPVKE